MAIINPGKLGILDAADWKIYPEWYYDTYISAKDLSVFDKLLDAYGGSLRSDMEYGRCHPALYWLTMMKYSKPYEVVWDAFAGNGTILDVAAMMGWENILATDINPIDKIFQADATTWTPGTNTVDLIVTHLPIPEQGSNFGLTEFYELINKAIPNMSMALKTGHVMAIVCCDVTFDGHLFPLEYAVNDVVQQTSMYRMIGRTVCDFYVGKRASYIRYKAYSAIKSGRFVSSRDTMLIYQKGT